MKNALIVGIIFVVSACATAEKYEAILDTWVGSSENALVDSWGVPDQVYENNGVKYLTYAKSRSGYIPGTAPTYQTQVIGNTAYTSSYGGSSGFAYTRQCKTTFSIVNARISKWRYEGNDCKAR